MVRLKARTPGADILPVTIGDCHLSEVAPEVITWVAYYDRSSGPAPNTVGDVDGARALSVGPGQAMVFGPVPATADRAASDQTDAWAVMRLEGAGARDVLARLTPLDLRPSAFAEGATARTLLNHMTISLTPVGDTAFEIMVFRSMVRTAIHELTRAMKGVHART